MIKTMRSALKIDMTYSINGFIYTLKKFPIFKDLFTDDIYSSVILKKIVRLILIVLSSLKFFGSRILYFFVIYFISSFLNNDNITSAFIHIYFIFTLIGMFINNKSLIINTKKYFSILVFNMDAKEYVKSSLTLNIILSLILNSIGFLVISNFISINLNMALCLVLFNALARVIGESFDISFYKKNNYFWYNNTPIYFILLGSLLLLGGLSYFNIFISDHIIVIITCIFIPLAILSYMYINSINSYRLIFQRINSTIKAVNNKQNSTYSRQAMVEVKEKDKNIDLKKLEGKKGYDLFNAIFFERHKQILLRSAKNYSFIIIGIIIILCFLSIKYDGFKITINYFLLNRLGWLVLIMYFINRGSIVTQAMFYNCDHAMLGYNFYREPKNLLGLFKKRLIMIIKVNLIPAFYLAIGSSILLFVSGGSSFINYIMIPLFIVVLSIFFSVHYLAIYYLLQPFNKDLEMTKISYQIVSMFTYFITYSLHDVVFSSFAFSLIGISITIVYIVLSLILVYKKSPSTFKIN